MSPCLGLGICFKISFTMVGTLISWFLIVADDPSHSGFDHWLRDVMEHVSILHFAVLSHYCWCLYWIRMLYMTWQLSQYSSTANSCLAVYDILHALLLTLTVIICQSSYYFMIPVIPISWSDPLLYGAMVHLRLQYNQCLLPAWESWKWNSKGVVVARALPIHSGDKQTLVLFS